MNNYFTRSDCFHCCCCHYSSPPVEVTISTEEDLNLLGGCRPGPDHGDFHHSARIDLDLKVVEVSAGLGSGSDSGFTTPDHCCCAPR